MKKLVALLLCTLLLCGATAIAEDLSAKTTEDLVALIRASQTELAMRNVDPEKVIYQNDELGIVVTIEGTSYRKGYFTVDGKVINGSDRKVTVSADSCYVNNWSCSWYSSFLYSEPGRNSKGDFSLIGLDKDCDIASFEDLQLVEIKLEIRIDGLPTEYYDMIITDFSTTTH